MDDAASCTRRLGVPATTATWTTRLEDEAVFAFVAVRGDVNLALGVVIDILVDIVLMRRVPPWSARCAGLECNA